MTLSERIDFSAAKQAGPAEIAMLELDGGKSPIIIQQITRDKAGEQTSVDNLRSGKLTIDRAARRPVPGAPTQPAQELGRHVPGDLGYS